MGDRKKIRSADDKELCVAVMPHWDLSFDEEKLANADLMAAAPELYEALSELTRVVGGSLQGYGLLTAPMDKAKAALAKARGEHV
jgi:hypothetical protein